MSTDNQWCSEEDMSQFSSGKSLGVLPIPTNSTFNGSSTDFSSYQYLRNSNPFNTSSFKFLEEEDAIDAFNDTDISPDIFNNNHMTMITTRPSTSASKGRFAANSSNAYSKPYQRSDYLEDNYRLKNQLIFSNGKGETTTTRQLSGQSSSTSQQGKASMYGSSSSKQSAAESVVSANDPAKDKRRERNKVFARKTRLKRKHELEELRDRVCALKIENDALKAIVNQKLPTISSDVFDKCESLLPENVGNMVCHIVAKMKNTETQLITSLLRQQKSFCISSMVAPDCPIVYASPGFAALTGYDVLHILGRNCRFLQGPETDMEQVAKFKKAIKEYQEVQVILRNYRKNGEAFWNFIQVAPMKDLQGMMTLVVGVQVEVENPTVEMCKVRIVGADETPFQKYSSSGDVQLPTRPNIKEENSQVRSLSFNDLKSFTEDGTDSASSNSGGTSAGSVRSMHSKTDSNSSSDY